MAEHQHLIERVIERKKAGVTLPVSSFVLDISRAEHAGGEGDERDEHHEDVVEVVDQHIGAWGGRSTRAAKARRGR